MASGKIPIIEILNRENIRNVGTVIIDGYSHVFWVNKNLTDEQKEAVRSKWQTVKGHEFQTNERYLTPELKHVYPWQGFWGAFETLRELLPGVGLDIDGSKLILPEDSQPAENIIGQELDEEVASESQTRAEIDMQWKAVEYLQLIDTETNHQVG